LLLATADAESADGFAARLRRALARPRPPGRGPAPTEWEDLRALAVRMAARVEPVEGTVDGACAGPRVLTDDHAPLAWLTDRALAAREDELRGERSGWTEDLAVLRARQDRLLALVGTSWAVLLLGIGLALRGVRP
jgi:hypothetical protein